MRKTLTLAAALLFAISLQAAEPTVDEILAKNAAARGGVEKLAAVKSMRLTGKLSMGGMDAAFTMAKKRPEMVKMEFTLAGMTGVQSFDGASGWMFMPFMGKKEPEALSGDMLNDMREQADFDGPFIDSAKKGNKVELLGKEDLSGKPAYKLKLTSKGGSESTVFVDAATFLEVKLEAKRKVQGQEIDSETTFGNYQTVEGLTMPFSIEMKPKGAPAGQTITVEKVEINPTLEDAAFKMPAAKPAAEAVKQ
jgi:outer membrane lipoprotein-sorting protein